MIDKSELTLVLGGNGRIGKQLLKLLAKKEYNFLAPRHNQLNLLDDYSISGYFLLHNDIKYIINLAAETTTMALNKERPVQIMHNTLLMNMNVLYFAQAFKVEKLVNIISSCAYGPAYSNDDYPETELLREYEFLDYMPHESVLPHGLAKKSIYVLGELYRQQYGLNVINVALNNIYGGVRDWSRSAELKVVDALIKKFVDGERFPYDSIDIYGTGAARRESLYVDDAAEGILQAFIKYDKSGLLNIGNGLDYSIREYANIIALLTRYKGKINFTGGNDGQMKKLFSIRKMKQELNWTPPTELLNGLAQTILDYKNYLKDNNK